MSEDKAHEFREQQVKLTIEGDLDAPVTLTSYRAGRAAYRPRGGRGFQHAEATAPAPHLKEAVADLRAEILSKVATLTHHETPFRIHALIREREVLGVADYQQRFAGIWGTVQDDQGRDLVFGRDQLGTWHFRRGLWEQCPPDMPELKSLDDPLPTIMSPYCGTLLHEAVGHALEAEYIHAGPLKYHLGDRISSDELTVMDRPDLEGFVGSMSHDDRGNKASQTTLIHRGFLVGDLGPGNGVFRRAAYRDLPLVRATNFLVCGGGSHPEDWIANIKDCYYICWIQKGHWTPGTHKFRILTGPVLRIHRGRVVSRANWAVWEMSTVDLLRRIVAVGNDVCMDPVVHWCVKKHQAVPISLGAPSLLLREPL